MKTMFGAVVATALFLIQPVWAIMPVASQASKEQACKIILDNAKIILDNAKKLPPDKSAQIRQTVAAALQVIIKEASPNTPEAKEAAGLLKGMNEAKAQILHSDSVPSSYFDGNTIDGNWIRFGRNDGAARRKRMLPPPEQAAVRRLQLIIKHYANTPGAEAEKKAKP